MSLAAQKLVSFSYKQLAGYVFSSSSGGAEGQTGLLSKLKPSQIF